MVRWNFSTQRSTQSWWMSIHSFHSSKTTITHWSQIAQIQESQTAKLIFLHYTRSTYLWIKETLTGWLWLLTFKRGLLHACHDSMSGGDQSQTVENILKWIEDEHKINYVGGVFNRTDWTLRVRTACPKQQNGVDCGVFCVMFIDVDSDNVPVSAVQQRNIPLYRIKIACDIMRGHVLYWLFVCGEYL